MTTNEKQVKACEILFKAAEILEEEGWCRGMLYDSTTGHFCTIGAINSAINRLDLGPDTDTNKVRVKTWVLVEEEITKTTGNRFSIAFWNDELVRDKRKVTRLLRRAAKKACSE